MRFCSGFAWSVVATLSNTSTVGEVLSGFWASLWCRKLPPALNSNPPMLRDSIVLETVGSQPMTAKPNAETKIAEVEIPANIVGMRDVGKLPVVVYNSS